MFQNVGNAKGRQGRGGQRVRTGNRAFLACVNCKEKKLKCDNKPTGCENCRRSSLACLVEDPSTGRHRPRNYLETLEERVALLEGILRRSRPDLANDHLLQGEAKTSERSMGSTTAVSAEAKSQSPPGSSALSKADDETDEHDALDELASKAGLLSLNAAGAEPHYLGSSSTFAFSRLINSSLRQVVLDNPGYSSTLREVEDESSMLLAPCLLPDYETAVKLSDAYFQNIHCQYPFLHEPTFRAWEATLAGGMAAFESPLSDSVPLFFLNMIYAVGALILPNSGYSAERLYISAQIYVDQILSRDNLESIQAILCCAVYSLRSSLGTSHWKLAGLALRQCIDLGYHRSSKRLRSTADPLRLDMQKRVFWSAYAMESQAAVMLGRPQGIPFQEVDAEYPADIDEALVTSAGFRGHVRTSPTEPPTDITKAIHTFRIRRLLARVHSSLYSRQTCCCCCSSKRIHQEQFQRLRSEIEEWRAMIPPEKPRTGEPLSLFATEDWYNIEYSYTILQLYRVQIIDRQAGGTDDVFLDCLRAAENICNGFRRQYLGKPTSYTWAAVHELFLAGLTYLHCLWTSPAAREAHRQGQVNSTCTNCTIVLVLMAERWDAAAPYRDIFETLANRTISMMHDRADEKRAQSTALAETNSWDEGGLMQWMTQMANVGMPEEFDGFLTGFEGEFGTG